MTKPTAKYVIKAEDRSDAAIRKIKGNLKGLSGAFGGIGTSLAGVLGVGGFGAVIKGGLDSADAIQKLAIKTRASTEFLSEMKHVAGLTGVAFEDVARGVHELSKRTGEAAEGTGEAAKAYKALGIDIAQVLALSPEERFLLVGDALSKVTDQSIKARLEMQLFGRTGGEVGKAFVNGAAGVAQMRAEARGLGLSLSREMADGAANANDAILRLTNAFAGIGQEMAISFAGPIEQIATFMRETLIPIIKGVVDSLFWLGDAFGGIAAAAVQFASGNFSGAGAIIGELFGGGDTVGRLEAQLSAPAEKPLTGGAAKRDREAEQTRKAIEEQTTVIKEIARNTGRAGFATALAG